MANIKLSPEQLRASGSKYTNSASTIREILADLTSEQSFLDSNWEGDAFNSFQTQFDELSPKITQFSELLDAISSQLINIATSAEETDAAWAKSIRPM